MNGEKSQFNHIEFERNLRKYLKQGKERLEKDLIGTQQAIKLVASDKTRGFIQMMDKGLDREEREFLSSTIEACMYQSFSYGYGIGKMEGKTNNKVYL